MSASDVDVSHLPTTTFSHRSLAWWGTLGFMVIEGFTLCLLAAAYFYLRLNEYDWPPRPTPDPRLLAPTVNTVLLLLTIIPMARASAAAHRFDRRGVVRWLAIATAMALVSIVLRGFELAALDIHYAEHAYASVSWALVVAHGTLLLTDFFETGVFTAMFASGRAEVKHYPDVSDAALYQYFLSAAAVPVYLIVYWGPRLM